MSELINPSIERREPHPVPEWVERVCAEFGVMESGAPKYRVIWNPDRRRPMNIINPETGQFVQKNLLRYPQVGCRWILEVLLPWEQYGPWFEDAFGPKPADGEYCITHVFQLDMVHAMQHPADHNTEFLSLDDFGQDNLRLLLHCNEKAKALQAWQLRNYDQEMLALDEKRAHEQFENVYDDTLGELKEIDKLAADSGLYTSFDVLPGKIEKMRQERARKEGRMIIH